ncbi:MULTISPECIES: autorepressor SdpR family transcription factor [unclassified Spirosoma]|uniref:autorepressor SdpR family transcription factor n=1 Tax=unclassified Spirosoma TaxID=2621999 RepID=UPI00095EAC0E|nr:MULTISPECIES: autorepressor SdpR family transcription factor [unclassified Spirosoma]MBN8820732.1 winged helix-turn-helix transcriptional regulator [Spirosoma sp.]OJW79434.1 MAG: transcriptional regulator [Spirosoma sp. 48-14]
MNTLFKALNDPTRRQILDLLREGDLNAGDIAERFDMTKPSISHHLDLLRQAGLVEATKQGQFVNYSLNTTVMDELLAWLLSFQKAPESEKTPLKNTH